MNDHHTSHIAKLLLAWYDENARSLPWRINQNPYTVWISEIMLQQTRVNTVIPFYIRWMEKFPDIETLSRATQQEVLQAWEGLGYYSRARNLHKTAQIIVEQFGGRFPETGNELEKLPGIGKYTAAEIASVSFGKNEAALDGNIRRVYSRLFNIEEPVTSSASEKKLLQLAWQHLPDGRAGDFNQALMDLGATICIPRRPLCEKCPLPDFCEACSLGIQELRPIMNEKKPVPHHTVTAAVICQDGRFLIAQRPQGGLLGGMWEFPGGKLEDGEDLPTCLRREVKEELDTEVNVGQSLGVYNHAYTHFQVTLHAFLCTISNGTPVPLEAHELCWVTPTEMKQYPMGKIDRQIASHLQKMPVSPC